MRTATCVRQSGCCFALSPCTAAKWEALLEQLSVLLFVLLFLIPFYRPAYSLNIHRIVRTLSESLVLAAGEGIPVGLGAAFRSKYMKDALGDEKADSVTCSFFGDGTCNVGQFYEVRVHCAVRMGQWWDGCMAWSPRAASVCADTLVQPQFPHPLEASKYSKPRCSMGSCTLHGLNCEHELCIVMWRPVQCRLKLVSMLWFLSTAATVDHDCHAVPALCSFLTNTMSSFAYSTWELTNPQ